MQTLKTQAGLNMIEILAILVVVALLGAMAVPRSGSQQTDAQTAGPERSLDAVKTAHATAIAELKRFPTVNELTTYIDDVRASAMANGVQVSSNGTRHTVPTFSDPACRTQTRAIADTVACIGTL